MLETIGRTDNEVMKEMGKFCKKFRADYMGISMKDFAEIRGLAVSNINAFERGGANNIMYLLHYYDEADSNLKEVFKNNIFEIYKR